MTVTTVLNCSQFQVDRGGPRPQVTQSMTSLSYNCYNTNFCKPTVLLRYNIKTRNNSPKELGTPYSLQFTVFSLMQRLKTITHLIVQEVILNKEHLKEPEKFTLKVFMGNISLPKVGRLPFEKGYRFTLTIPLLSSGNASATCHLTFSSCHLLNKNYFLIILVKQNIKIIVTVACNQNFFK